MANIQQRKTADGKISYRVQIRLKGHPPQQATFARRTDAKLWAQQTESAIREGRHLVTNEAKKHTLADLVERHLEALQRKAPQAYPKRRQQLHWWKERLGVRALTHITPALIAEERDALLAENIGTPEHPRYRSPATANRYLAALSKACAVAVREWHWLRDNPVARVQKERESPGRVRYLSAKEKTALLKSCANSPVPALLLIVTLALTTGMRRGEIRALRWPDIDVKRGSIVIHNPKNKERRAVPIVPQVVPLLAKQAKVRRIDTDLVFARADDEERRKKLTAESLSADAERAAAAKAKLELIGKQAIDFDGAFQNAVLAAKIENFHFHDLRHTAASYLAMSGATAPEIAAVLGHKTLQMVKRYAHLSDPHTSAVVERMTKKFFG